MEYSDAAFEEFWDQLTRKGDPARQPNLVRMAFDAGFAAGRRGGHPGAEVGQAANRELFASEAEKLEAS